MFVPEYLDFYPITDTMFTPLRITFVRSFMIFVLSVMANLNGPAVHAEQIMVVSDTTGYSEWTEEESTNTVYSPYATAREGAESEGLMHWALWFSAIPLLILILIFISPLLLILAVIFLLARQRRKRKTILISTPPPESATTDRQKRDRHIMHLAVSGGITLWSVIFGWELLALGAMVYACIEGVRLYQCLRNDNP